MPRHRTSPWLVAAGIALAAASGCTATPRSLALLNEQLNQAADAVNDLRMSIGDLQTSIDSLRTVVAKQDTTIQRLANAAGIPVVK